VLIAPSSNSVCFDAVTSGASATGYCALCNDLQSVKSLYTVHHSTTRYALEFTACDWRGTCLCYCSAELLCHLLCDAGHVGHSAAQTRPKHHHDNEVRVFRPLLRSFSRLTQASSKAAHTGHKSEHRHISDTAVSAAADRTTGHVSVQVARAGPFRAGPRKVPAAPPTECGHGAIAFIKCWLDEDGYVAGIAFEGKGGGKGPELCHTRGTHETLFLHEGETITEIISCK
jgi:hypothetical protein